MAKGEYDGSVDWGALGSAARDNAVGLLADAEALLGRGSFHRAYSLAVLGLEELGKYVMCLRALFEPGALPRVWSELNSHVPKLQNINILIALWSQSFEPTDILTQLQEVVARESVLKMRGFYVDWFDNRVTTPHEVDEHAATSALALLREMVEVTSVHDIKLGLERLAEPGVSETIHETMDAAKEFLDHVKTLDPAEAERLVRQLLDQLVTGYRDLQAGSVAVEA
jgi:AbiV family abortive infection protein